MYHYKTDGIVIRGYDYGEGHRIMVLFTENYGKIKAVARGSRKSRSKYGASLEPLTENHFLLYRKPGRPLFTITGCKILNSHFKLRKNMLLFSYGSLMLECVDIVCEKEDTFDRNSYELLKQALKDMETGATSSTALLFLFRLLKYAGYRLNFFNCIVCEKKEVENPQFSLTSGGILCSRCRKTSSVHFPISSETIKSIRKLSVERDLDSESENEISNIIRKFVKYQYEKDLKSLKFMQIFKKCTSKTL